MKYSYEDLSPEQFEHLVVILCQRLLGIAVQGFSKGPDGGRDAKFVGVAECFPSKAAPWHGTIIIQSKHTNGYNRNFSETDFYSKTSSSSIIAKEIERIKLLWESRNLDHYMLFSNRRLAGNAETEIKDHISKETKVPVESIYLCSVEQLELFLKRFPDVPRTAGIDPVDAPLIVSPDDLAEVVQALALHQATIKAVFENPPTPRISYEKKNDLNNMTIDYAKEQRKRYLKETGQIKMFLAAPENQELLNQYESVIEEFQLKITAKRKDYQTFDEVTEYIVTLLFNRDAILRQYKSLTRAMLFYMYWNCDIGVTEDVKAL